MLLFCTLSMQSQRLRPFAGVSFYSMYDFKDYYYIDIMLGRELKVFNFLKPEIQFSLKTGDLRESSNYNDKGIPIDVNYRKASSYNLSFSPKFIIWPSPKKSEDYYESDIGHIHILPTYTISKSEATSDYVFYNLGNKSPVIFDTQTETSIQHTFGIAVGIDIYMSDKDYSSLAFNIYYNGFTFDESLNKLNHNKDVFSTKASIGAGVVYYFSFKKKPTD